MVPNIQEFFPGEKEGCMSIQLSGVSCQTIAWSRSSKPRAAPTCVPGAMPSSTALRNPGGSMTTMLSREPFQITACVPAVPPCHTPSVARA
ncbi:MAG: hypothetical protein IPJ41_00530 [Phycisphaerales bacterium]|nr:hypothetical protein [Phycisphaerales bacterium]